METRPRADGWRVGLSERFGRNALGNGRARRNSSASTYLQGGNKHPAGSDKNPIADLCTVFRRPVIVTRDGSGTDVHVTTYTRITDIAQVIHLASGRHVTSFHLDEVPSFYAFLKLRPR